MGDRQILFSGPMVRALLAGTKTQTRRVIKPRRYCSLFDGTWSDSYVLDPGNAEWRDQEVSYHVGDRLWVREAWRTQDYDDHFRPSLLAADNTRWRYEADGELSDPDPVAPFGKLRPGMFMPRWASRLTLTVTDVRVERLQDISVEDARAEGCPFTHDGRQYDPPPPEVDSWQGYGRASFCLLWSQINGPGSWDENPWVAAYTFTVAKHNIDSPTGEA
ncbi:MAG: hypothetical protein P0Y66_22415 [Candidatus Kaistia colombiensis]|nr:MAG: hypothetical protein P0Y66_22415 [Kaistia sp.]